MLHGAGAAAANVASMVTPYADVNALIVLAPDSRSSSWDFIVSDYGPDVSFIDAMLDAAFGRYSIDARRIGLGGFSDGASYAVSLGLINGELFTHVLAFSPGFAGPTETRDSPRFFISHGRQDRVLPIESCSRRLVPALRRAGYEVDYREFDGGHIVPEAIARAAIDWFIA